MIKYFLLSYKIKNAYRVNSIIYSFKQVPLLKKLLPFNLYQHKLLKTIANIISTIGEILTIFLGKLLYVVLMVGCSYFLYEPSQINDYLHVFVVLTIMGGLFNTEMFTASKDKLYAIVLLKMDAKKYALSNYYYRLCKSIIGFLIVIPILGQWIALPLWLSLLLPFFVVAVKLIAVGYSLYTYQKTKKIKFGTSSTPSYWITLAILFVITYLPPKLGFVITPTIFVVILLISIPLAFYSFRYMNRFDSYRNVYRSVLTPEVVTMLFIKNPGAMVQEQTQKKIVLDPSITSTKEGFAYFHDIFVKRHRKILLDSAKRITIGAVVVLVAILIIIQMFPLIADRINHLMLSYLPYFVFIMYMLNRGQVITQAMFMNCDHSMLTYAFYRTPKAILDLFTLRLKTVVSINLLPTFVIAIGLPILLLMTGGTDNPLQYLVLFVSILAMSIFFSIHYLIIYYLFQPYNKEVEMTSVTYRIIQTVTYFVAYYMIQIRIPTLSFGIAIVIFTLVYCLIALLLAYQLAPKTFKLRN